jgi:class 3 adenylate cyclase
MAEPGRPVQPPSVSLPDPPAPGASSAAPHLTRGFLFADLRDYTSYVDAHGDHAGARLLERYRALVRGAVAAAGGAEIRTEGDSFFVVFDSASAAVRCGQEIIAAAAATDSADPIQVGVGVHAGETVETAEGFVGSAVNIAARICALAKAGEVAVSETVRALTRTYIDVDFEPLGTRRLKGVAEPVAIYKVVPHNQRHSRPPGAALARTRRVWWIAAGAGVFLVAAIGFAAMAGRLSAAPTASPAAAAASPGTSPSTGASPGGSASSASPSTSPTPAAPASLGPFPNQAEAAILATLPPALSATCVRGGTSDDARLAGFRGFGGDVAHRSAPGSLAGVTCRPDAGATRLYIMLPAIPGVGAADNVSDPGDFYLGILTAAYNIPLGSCATDKRATELWTGPSGGGQLACMNPFEGRPWIYFTFGKGRYLAFATRDDSDYGALYQWWVELKTFLP